MLGPLPPSPAADRPELPRVRLDVRASGGPAGSSSRPPARGVTYEVGADEFLIGGAGGCDLRLPTGNLPPVIAQITRKPDGVRVRRLTPVLAVALNGVPLAANAPTPLSPGDTLTLAGVEITVHIQHTAIVSPRFVPVEEARIAEREPPVPETPPRPDFNEEARRRALDAEEASRREEWNRRDAELIRRARAIDQQAEELEADRVIWYRRRQEMEAELERHPVAAAGEQERELQALRVQFAEVERLRAEAQELVAKAESDAAELQIDAEAEAEEIRRKSQEEATRLRESVASELAVHEPKLRESREQQARLAAAAQELARQRDLFAADRDIFDKARETFEAHRAADTDRLNTREKELAARDAELNRVAEQLRDDRATFDRDRAQFQDDLVRLERRTAALEEQERVATERTREVDVRLEQLKRDSAEWEETVRLAAAEEERLRAEAERLDRQKTELDGQSAILAERAGQLESQQAVLAVMRAKLDRTRQEAEREGAQLAAARTREDEAFAELRERIREAEELRAELASIQVNTAEERRRLDERDSLLAASLEELRQQREALAAESARLQAREAELDGRSTEFAEQAGTLKGRMTQALDLQARLEADRVALREREAALAQAEDARAALQEQLRRRAEVLTSRAKSLDEVARQVAADRAAVEQARSLSESDRLTSLDELNARRKEVEGRSGEVERLAADYAEKEQALARQVARLKDVGAAVAAERKSMAEARAKWEADRAAATESDQKARDELAAFRERALAEIEALRREAPELEVQAAAALDRLSSARDMLRGHLSELHDFARLSREDLAAIRVQVRQEADRLREQEESLNRAKGEHRLAVTAFRQQLIDWQGQVTDMKRTLASSESRLDARQAAVEAATKQADATTVQLAEQAEQLRRERDAVASRRTEVERHLADMREWYRKKLRELAASKAVAEDDPPVLKLHDTPHDPTPADDLDPGDRQLGELLQSHGLVDADTLTGLWAEAARQRRTLRQVLLASGVITLYQLALIEAGNLDSLMVGRFRVIDRLRVTPREAIYRVSDPSRPGAYLLRHLAEAEMHDAVHPDEFRQRFAAARDAAHPNLAAVSEVLEVAGRPAALQEWLTGLFSADWPAHAAHAGCWVRLVTMAASAIDAAHRHGLVHGRLTSDSFVLTPAVVLKVTGFGEPPWLTPGPASPVEPSVAADLRALGQVAFGWSQLAAKVKKPAKAKPFPASLLAIVRRLEADPEPPMADTVAAERPYESAAQLLADLNRVARETPFSDTEWEKLLKHVADTAPDAPAGLKRSA
jgi:hypothetical protein